MIGQHTQTDLPNAQARADLGTGPPCGMGGAIWGDTTLPWRGPYSVKHGQPRNGEKRQWPAGPDNGGAISAHIMNSSNKWSEHNIGQLLPILIQWQPPAQMQSGQTSKIVSGSTIQNAPNIITGSPFGNTAAASNLLRSLASFGKSSG